MLHYHKITITKPSKTNTVHNSEQRPYQKSSLLLNHLWIFSYKLQKRSLFHKDTTFPFPYDFLMNQIGAKTRGREQKLKKFTQGWLHFHYDVETCNLLLPRPRLFGRPCLRELLHWNQVRKFVNPWDSNSYTRGFGVWDRIWEKIRSKGK